MTRKKKCNRIKSLGSEKGMVMVLAVVLMSVLLFVGGTTAIRSINQTRVTARDVDDVRTFYVAEAGLEWATGELQALLPNNLAPTQQDLDALPQPSLPGYQFTDYSLVPDGGRDQEVIQSGDYIGLIGFVQDYLVTCEAQGSRRSAKIERVIEHQFIPLFQFGVFYDKDLEIFPGPQMHFAGRIHTNANLFIGAESHITCDSYVTAVGQIWHYRKDGAHVDPPGPVEVVDHLGVYQDMWTGGYWLDNRQADWETEAIERWGGMVRDQAHATHNLTLPLPPLTDMYEIIERGQPGDPPELVDARYWYKAAIRIVDGVMTDSLGNPLSPPPGVYNYVNNAFMDQREGQWMDVLELDVAAMMSAGFSPPNGIIYISGAGSNDAVRIRNASQLPTGGLTIATDNPLYILGNYNNIAKKGSAIAADAITFLSSAWNDALSSGSLNNRIPVNTAINACIMTGHVESVDGGSYSGGLENLPRFLEKWSGVTLTFRGSIIDLWFSQKATASWNYGYYYTAPNRNWGFDTDLLEPANWPPGTPRVHTVVRGRWRQLS